MGPQVRIWHASGPAGLQVGSGHGHAVASTCCLIMRRLLIIVLRKVPFISGSSNRIGPRAWVSITSSSLVLAGATGANVARACSVNGPNRDTSVKLLTGSYSVISMLPSTRRPLSVRTNRAVVPTAIGPGEVWVMEVTAGSHLGWFWKWSVATNWNTWAEGRSITWDAASRTPRLPSASWNLDAHGLLTRLDR